MAEPVSTPCGHHFCRACLLASFERAAVTTSAARTFRARKQPKACPRCRADLADFAASMQPNLAAAADLERLRAALAAAQAALARARAAFEEVTDAALQPADAAAAVGWRVEVWWPQEEAWFGGVVARAVEGGDVEVAYDDGDRERHSLAAARLRWLRPTAPAGARDLRSLRRRRRCREVRLARSMLAVVRNTTLNVAAAQARRRARAPTLAQVTRCELGSVPVAFCCYLVSPLRNVAP